MSILQKIEVVVIVFSVGFASCSKLPESETAKKIGSQPKQVIDNASADVNKALQQGTERRQEADKKLEGDGK